MRRKKKSSLPVTVLLGSTGVGKSTFGQYLTSNGKIVWYNKECPSWKRWGAPFKVGNGRKVGTSCSMIIEAVVDGKRQVYIDTPGLGDGDGTKHIRGIKAALEKANEMYCGVNQFALLLQEQSPRMSHKSDIGKAIADYAQTIGAGNFFRNLVIVWTKHSYSRSAIKQRKKYKHRSDAEMRAETQTAFQEAFAYVFCKRRSCWSFPTLQQFFIDAEYDDEDRVEKKEFDLNFNAMQKALRTSSKVITDPVEWQRESDRLKKDRAEAIKKIIDLRKQLRNAKIMIAVMTALAGTAAYAFCPQITAFFSAIMPAGMTPAAVGPAVTAVLQNPTFAQQLLAAAEAGGLALVEVLENPAVMELIQLLLLGGL